MAIERPSPALVGAATLAAIIPQRHFAGNKVPTLVTDSVSTSILLAGVMSSFLWDWALRFRISTTMNWTHVSRVVLPPLSAFAGGTGQRLRECILRVNAATPELASAWNEVFASSRTYETTQVGLDPDVPLSKLRIGTERDLIDRVKAPEKLAAVPYVPNGRGGLEPEATAEEE